MLKALQENLTTDEIAVLREWLKSKGSNIFRKCIRARVHENQIEATRHFSDERERMDIDGRAMLNTSRKYRFTLEVLEEFSDPKTKPYTVKITEE